MGVSERFLQVTGKPKFQARPLWVKLHQLVELALHLDDEVFVHDWGAAWVMLIVSLSEGVLCDGNSGIAILCFPLRNSLDRPIPR